MKTFALTLLYSLIVGQLFCQTWFKYELLVDNESEAIEMDNKKFITHLRNQNYKIYNYLSHNEFITFESPDELDSLTITSHLKNLIQRNLIECSRSEISKPKRNYPSNSSNTNFICNNNSISVLDSDNFQDGAHDNVSWFVVNIAKAGELDLIIRSNQGTDDIDFTIWGPFEAIPNPTEEEISMPLVRSNYSTNKGQTGLSTYFHSSDNSGLQDQFEESLTVESGEIYLIRIENFSNSGKPYTLTLEGTADLNCINTTKNINTIEHYLDSIKHSSFACNKK